MGELYILMKSIYIKLKSIIYIVSTNIISTNTIIRSVCTNNRGQARFFCLLLSLSILNSNSVFSQGSKSSSSSSFNSSFNYPQHYKQTQQDESEFDNYNDGFVSYWQNADENYQDTVFGELLYSEPSTSTKLEMLRLLSKETPSTIVFIHALSMGLSVDEMLLASLEYQPEKARDLASSAVSLLPFLQDRTVYQYSTYNLDSLEKYINGLTEQRGKGSVDPGNENIPYSVKEVINNFFDDRRVLAPYPDWLDGQMHFMASAKELLELNTLSNKLFWYQSNNTQSSDDRPIFISLYENNKTILIDGEARIRDALYTNKDIQLPVVFIFNRLNERPIASLGYPATLQGVQDAYAEKNLMVTPTPEWHSGEYHAQIDINEFYKKFHIPRESDFEPEAWERLIKDARNYDVKETSIVVVILGAGGNLNVSKKQHAYSLFDNSMLAAWDNPRTESQYPYVIPQSGNDALIDLSLDAIVGQGMVINRPDLIAALNEIGVTQIPVSFYYLDNERVKPYFRGPRSLIQAALGAELPNIVPPSGGFLPPEDLPPASPPGLP